VYSLTPYGVRKVSPLKIREGVFKEEPGPKRMFEVYTAEELAKMGFDAKRLHSLFWYRAPQFPYYEPRLVPLQEAYMGDIDLDDDAQARLRELYGLKAKRKRPWPF